MKNEELDYKSLLPIISKYASKGRSESANYLNWFLENIYRLDETTADDCICDQSNDKGIDGIYVDHNSSEIIFFQSKISQSPGRTLGDKVLKEFAGSLQQFETKEQIEAVINGQANEELKRILSRNRIAELVSQGYAIRGVFVCNSERDHNTIEIEEHFPAIAIYCSSDVTKSYIDFDADEGVKGEFSFDASYAGHVHVQIDADTEVFLLPVAAAELVKLDGIQDGVLFSQNVRYSLGSGPIKLLA